MSIISVGKWNYLRNGLDYNHELEIDMLDEELGEFRDGMLLYFDLATNNNLFKGEAILESVVEMVDAYCDFMFVYTGTSIKSLGSGTKIDYGHQQSLMNSVLTEILVTHGAVMFPQGGQPPLLERCYQYVIEANEAKPIKKTKSKVTKGKNFIDPKEKIKQELVEDAGFLANSDEALERYKREILDKVKTDDKPVNIADLPTDEGA